jgi:probable phosphoglycerate mutase
MAGFTVQRPSTKGPRHLKELGRRRWLIRHGESAANAGAVTTDPATIPLTEAGRDQARSIATTITRKPDLIVVSFYLRTQQTAEPSMRRFPDVLVETWPMQEFTYLSPGRCVGTTAAQRRPLVEAYWQRCDAGHVDGVGAESFTAMLQRVRALRDRLTTHPAGFIVVFTHGQIMQSLRLLTLYPDMDDQLLMARFLAFDRQEPVRNGQILTV